MRGTLAAKQNAATGQRGYHDTIVYHITQGRVYTTPPPFTMDKIAGHQSGRGRGGIFAVMH